MTDKIAALASVNYLCEYHPSPQFLLSALRTEINESSSC